MRTECKNAWGQGHRNDPAQKFPVQAVRVLEVITKTGTAYINSETPELIHYTEQSPLFRAVQSYFFGWVGSQNPEVTTGVTSFEELNGSSYYDMRDKLSLAVNVVVSYMNQNSLCRITTREFDTMNLQGIFQD